ncbi:MAG TPA: bacillithiol transferase BstA [Longimicrobiaceae bacterium]
MSDDLRYPVGRYTPGGQITREQRDEWIGQVAEAPARLRAAVHGLDDAQLDTPYRGGGWTVRQVVHHVPDSHMNAYTRFKLGLTEDVPTIKTYDEAAWADLPDTRLPIEGSLVLLEKLHERWVPLLRALDEQQWKRTFRHPEWGEMTLEDALGMYAWHGSHHVAHVTRLRERQGW